MQPAVIGARRLAKDPWEVMAEWGHTLDGRSPSYPTAPRANSFPTPVQKFLLAPFSWLLRRNFSLRHSKA